MKRLIILPNNIGDVIMAVPLFEALKRKTPADELHFLVETGYEGGVLNNPYIDKIHLFPRSASAQALRDEESFPIESFQLGAWIETLTAMEFDLVINLSQHGLYGALSSLISAKEIVGLVLSGEGIDCVNGFWSRYLFAIPYSRRCNNLHAIDLYKKIAGVENDPSEPKIFLSDLEKEYANSYLVENGWNGESLFVFQPGSAIAAKMWKKERWIELGKLVVAQGSKILITGAPAEMELCKAIASELGDSVIVTAGKTTFRESLTLASFASFIVTGDTALMHAGAALGVTVLALFGATSPVETGPYGSGHAVFVTGSCAKQPCFLHSCDQPTNCIDEISAEEVFASTLGGSVPFRTEIVNGTYALRPETGSLSRFYDVEEAVVVQGILTRNAVVIIPESLKNGLLLLENRLSLATDSLKKFAAGDQSAYETYAEQIGLLQDSLGIGAFLATMVNLGLNSIPLTDLTTGVSAMLELVEGYALRLREVLNG